MDLDDAVDVFRELEMARYLDTRKPDPRDGGDQWDPPIYDVRLDANTDRNDARGFRLYVRMGTGSADTPQEFAKVLSVAKRFKLNVSLDNNGIELR